MQALTVSRIARPGVEGSAGLTRPSAEEPFLPTLFRGVTRPENEGRGPEALVTPGAPATVSLGVGASASALGGGVSGGAHGLAEKGQPPTTR